jgi:hypothetical protein
MKNTVFITLIILLCFLGIGAIFGGGAMIIDPSGELLQMPISMIENTPFTDFLFPGIILFSAFGLVPGLVVWGLITRRRVSFLEYLNILPDMHWAWTFVIYIGFGLVIWIQIQMQVINDVHWVHDLYTYWAILLIALALMPGVRISMRK